MTPPCPPPTSEHRLLIVDDDHDCADSLGELLRLASDWQVEVAYDSAQAVSLVLLHPPDAVLLDLELHGASGFDVADRLRAALAGRVADFVAVTGNSALQADASHDIRFAKAFMKPPDASRLLRTLAALEAMH
jgi:DNA-binding response OmpR family regulator